MTEPKKRGRKRREYDEKDARVAAALAQYGIPHEHIAAHLGMSLPILSRLYSDDMKRGELAANRKVVECLFKKATEGNDTTAQIFWCKTRLRWSETQKVDLTSSDGSMSPANAFDLSALSPEQIAALRGELDARKKD